MSQEISRRGNTEAVSPPAEHSEAVNKFAFHYAQSHVWRGEANNRRAQGDEEGAALAEQHGLGHALAVAHIRGQLPSHVVNDIQSQANAHGSSADFVSHLRPDWQQPQPATAVPVNNGGYDGTAKWEPPK